MNLKDKPRLFVDLDGTLAEWRNIELTIDKQDDAESAAKKLFDILQIPGYFYSLKENSSLVNAIKNIIKENNIDVYILTCYPENGPASSPLKEKDMWLDKNLPEIKKENRIYVPYGKCKNDYIPGGIKKEDTLLDDKSSNLHEFVEGGGQGIKFLNGVNSSYGTWIGNRITINKSGEDLAIDLNNIILNKKQIVDKKPARIHNYFNYKTFDFKTALEPIKDEYELYIK